MAVVPALVCSTNNSKREYQKCQSCEGQQGPVDVALCLASEVHFTTKCNLRDCLQDTIRAWGYKGDDVAKTGEKLATFLLWEMTALFITEQDAVLVR